MTLEIPGVDIDPRTHQPRDRRNGTWISCVSIPPRTRKCPQQRHQNTVRAELSKQRALYPARNRSQGLGNGRTDQHLQLVSTKINKRAIRSAKPIIHEAWHQTGSEWEKYPCRGMSREHCSRLSKIVTIERDYPSQSAAL